ncbi:uncharacterized protein isoform X1 [Leptinotarsa decemlineata]|uniref:uncharacterized protein isoform X1 n=1 Tax=Leptinotarsa decemlineata TaxID=7539 RepID=UPI003D30B988
MYRPPQNNNIVKSIKNKFENIENDNFQQKNIKDGYRNNLNLADPAKKVPENFRNGHQITSQILQRQTSDQGKCNIKRTPAFRVDKNLEQANEFQRNCVNRSTLFESKVKQFSAVRQNCDSNNYFVNNVTCDKQPLLNTKMSEKGNNFTNSSQSVLIKSKSSLDFMVIRNMFDHTPVNSLCEKIPKDKNNYDSEDTENINNCDLNLLYTEPIPKALRNKTVPAQALVNNTGHNSTTHKQGNESSVPTLVTEGLTDTLKTALKRPLPIGPAPRKPPRVFQILNTDMISNNLEKNPSFLHESKKPEKKVHTSPTTANKKADPKYMLTKLENALRNNKLRTRKQPKVDRHTTSGEDSDDSLLFNSKSNRTLPRLPSQDTEDDSMSAFNFNCLNGLRFGMTNYEKIKEPSSNFFVGSPQKEPVYAEPFHYRKDSLDSAIIKREGSTGSNESARNSLYYMSSPLLTEAGELIVNLDSSPNQKDDVKLPNLSLNSGVNRQISAENSSLSSFASDMDSASSPMEESSKIKDIIECYEKRTSPSATNGRVDNTNRVERVKNSIQETLDASFTNDCALRDSDSENNDESKVSDIIKKFETYRQTMPKYCRSQVSTDTLFYCCMIIERVRDEAQIKFKYPSCVEIPQNLEDLCFPESENVPLDIENTSQNYSLLITNDKGERMYGYCRRVLPEGSTCCLPLAYCILSKHRAPRFYKKILLELETRHGLPNRYRDELISQFYRKKFPAPGDSIKINLTNIEPKPSKTDKENLEESIELVSYVHVNRTGEYIQVNNNNNSATSEQIFINDSDIKNSCSVPSYMLEKGEKIELVLTLNPDARYEDSDLKLLHQLPAEILLKIFSSMLLERKVIFISSMISKLSACVDCLQGILYPFSWHHTFIPILPKGLWDIVESPTPVICGVLSKEVVEYHHIENGIVVDLDSRSVWREEGDENKIFSGSMQKVWKRSIALADKAATSKEYIHSVYLSDAYLQVFVVCFKDYKQFFVDGVFQTEEFIKHGKTKGIRRFLKMFTETYMFLAFVDAAINTPENLLEFDRKIVMYGSDDSNVILDKLLEWKR